MRFLELGAIYQPHRPEHEVLVPLDLVQIWDADAEVHGCRLPASYPGLAIVCDPQGAQIGLKHKKTPVGGPIRVWSR